MVPRPRMLLPIALLTLVLTEAAHGQTVREAALARVVGAPVACVHDFARHTWETEGQIVLGAADADGVVLDAGVICAKLFARHRSTDEAWAWLVFGHEVGHVRGMRHEDCPTPTTFGIRHAALFAKRLGAGVEYRRWLRRAIAAYAGTTLRGERPCH